ncbi:MAG: translation initiation factor eIF-2B [Chloroflexota bacterium]
MNVQEIASRIEAIREEERRGATRLARQAVDLLADMATDPSLPNDSFADLFVDTARRLGRARPSMASLANGVGSVLAAWLEAGGAHNVGAARAAAAEEAQRWAARQDSSVSIIADHTAEVVTGAVITLGHSSTVLHALIQCWSRGVISGVIVAESRPLCEGRKMAAALSARGIPTTLITDAEIGLFAMEAGAAVVGAGMIRPNGALVNRTGTLLLALAARRCRVPFYTLAEVHKIAPAEGRGRQLPLEERDAGELLPEPIPGVAVRNVTFDITPAHYLTGYITERGLLDRKDVVALSKEAPGALMLGLQSPGPGS